MFKYLIVYRLDPNIWWEIQGPSYISSLKETLKYNIYYFGVASKNYTDSFIKNGYKYNQLLDEDEEVFFPTPEQLTNSLVFHMSIFEDINQYIIFQISMITGKIQQLEKEDLV